MPTEATERVVPDKCVHVVAEVLLPASTPGVPSLPAIFPVFRPPNKTRTTATSCSVLLLVSQTREDRLEDTRWSQLITFGARRHHHLCLNSRSQFVYRSHDWRTAACSPVSRTSHMSTAVAQEGGAAEVIVFPAGRTLRSRSHDTSGQGVPKEGASAVRQSRLARPPVSPGLPASGASRVAIQAGCDVDTPQIPEEQPFLFVTPNVICHQELAPLVAPDGLPFHVGPADYWHSVQGQMREVLQRHVFEVQLT